MLNVLHFLATYLLILTYLLWTDFGQNLDENVRNWEVFGRSLDHKYKTNKILKSYITDSSNSVFVNFSFT